MSKYYGSRLTRAVGWAILYLIVILLFAFLFSCRTIQVQGDYLNSKMYGVVEVEDVDIESAKKEAAETIIQKLQQLHKISVEVKKAFGKSLFSGYSWGLFEKALKNLEKADELQGDMMPKEKK